WLTDDRMVRRRRVGRMTAPAVSSAVSHVGVQFEPIPAAGERGPIGERSVRRQQIAHGSAVYECVAFARNRSMQRATCCGCHSVHSTRSYSREFHHEDSKTTKNTNFIFLKRILVFVPS